MGAKPIKNPMISDADGQRLVEVARQAVTQYLQTGNIHPTISLESPMMGVFVTLHALSNEGEETLRGCIGYPSGQERLYDGVVRAAIAAATEDPRFETVTLAELATIIFEVSVLTPLERIMVERPVDRKQHVRVGTDGLVIKYKECAGLLLPQVPYEQGWNVDDFLAGICHKAGLPSDKWMDHRAELYRFQALVYKEKSPAGPAARIEFPPSLK